MAQLLCSAGPAPSSCCDQRALPGPQAQLVAAPCQAAAHVRWRMCCADCKYLESNLLIWELPLLAQCTDVGAREQPTAQNGKAATAGQLRFETSNSGPDGAVH